jgi:hypothetical protein
MEDRRDGGGEMRCAGYDVGWWRVCASRTCAWFSKFYLIWTGPYRRIISEHLNQQARHEADKPLVKAPPMPEIAMRNSPTSAIYLYRYTNCHLAKQSL